jgi:hypothetical protein
MGRFVQLGPFATLQACQGARSNIPALYLDKMGNQRESMSRIFEKTLLCLPSR